MPHDDFSFQSFDEGPPWRNRSVFDGYIPFHDGDATVLISPPIAKRLARYADEAFPNETVGLLAGRTFADAVGLYTVVLNAARGGPSAGTPGHVRLSAKETAHLKDDLAEREPGCDVIGWWHSHQQTSGYSRTDFENQAIWANPNHVGLLVFARDKSWGYAYLGPNARHLTPTEPVVPAPTFTTTADARTMMQIDAPPLAPEQLTSQSGAARRQTPTAPDDDRPIERLDTGRRVRNWRLALVTLAAVIVALSVGLVVTIAQRSNERSHSTELPWRCNRVDPTRERCTVMGEDAAVVKWRSGGAIVASGSSVVIALRAQPMDVELVDAGGVVFAHVVLPARQSASHLVSPPATHSPVGPTVPGVAPSRTRTVDPFVHGNGSQ